MIIPSFRRSTLRRLIRILTYLTIIIITLDSYTTFSWYKIFNHNLASNTVTRVEDLPYRLQNQNIYIVAQFWTSAGVIVDHWANAVLNLVDTLGKENVYLSILESGSLDNTEEVLKWLDTVFDQRQIRRTIVLDPTTHKDAVEAGPIDADGKPKQGWIYTGESDPPGQKELRRIPYLAELRNRGLEPMLRLQREQGTKFDKILYLNDVIFQPSDVLSLLATNKGVFDVACGIDFHYPPAYYDTFVLRDDLGQATADVKFPYFRSTSSRNAMLKGLPTPVKSCWNGMILVDTAPYYEQETAVNTYDLDGKPITTKEGLKFRGIPDSLASIHLEGSECCLVHADLIARGQAQKGIFMNPAVRVGYTESKGLKDTSYNLVHTGPVGLGFITGREYFVGVWRTRYKSWFRPNWVEMRDVWSKITAWKKEGAGLGEEREEVGAFCTVNEMQILIWNGWKHVWWS